MAADHEAMPAPAAPASTPRARPWYSKILGLCFVIFCFEIGVFLVVFPWLDLWETNALALYAPWLADVWGSPYLRGALSGLGLVNIYISFLEILRLVRGQFET
jgi:hypothetical protein